MMNFERLRLGGCFSFTFVIRHSLFDIRHFVGRVYRFGYPQSCHESTLVEAFRYGENLHDQKAMHFT